MKNSGIFFILGAGASVDSGIPTYRGAGGIYTKKGMKNVREILCMTNFPKDPSSVWKFIGEMHRQIKGSVPGPTYEKIREISKLTSPVFALTQNIDGHVATCDIPFMEMHGNHSTMTCMGCGKVTKFDCEEPVCDACGKMCRPNVVLFDEELPVKKVHHTFKMLNTRFRYVVVVGTTLAFPYLRVFMNKAKHHGAKVVHINPDEEYADNVQRREFWIQKDACEGLSIFTDRFLVKTDSTQKSEN